ncbi:nuclear pore complex protein (DUF3414) [Rhynchospora pubera]|uniref:Nuclear pore complex protein (DUF3414) n=1 Tax=Rhynchospora pubera TaxID=906938 RepID=A0AAV8GSZ2_9POAL|nr:nuclear pore complex protein (DUF3414) [Rhynchospora pubera]
MASSHELLATIEAAVLSSSPPSPTQRIELLHSIRASLPSLQSLLSYPGPKESDRAQVRSREVKLPNQPPIPLDDTDVEIALKLSDDLNLNEISCVCLLVKANTEWSLTGRDKLERYRLAAGLWYMERRDLITSLYILLRSVVLDQGLDPDLLAEIQKHLEDLFNSGLRSRFVTLIRELNRAEPAGYGRHTSEQYVKDIRGTLVERRAIVNRERLSLSQCLALSILISQTSSKDIKEALLTLKDCTAEVNEHTGVIELQIIFALTFSAVIALVSDALRASHLSSDASFRQEFHELVMTASTNSNVEGFVGVVRLAWVVHLILTHDKIPSRAAISNASLRDMSNLSACLELICSQNVFQFLLAKVITSAAYKNDDEDMTYMYSGYLHKMMMCFVSNPISRDKVKEMKDRAMSMLSSYMLDDSEDDAMVDCHELSVAPNQPFVSLLELISEIYQKVPELLHGNDEMWQFVIHAGEDHTNIQTLISFLRLLSTLASDEEGAARVHELLQGRAFRSIGWSKLFDCLTIYEERFKKALQSSSSAVLPDFPKPEAQALVAYLKILKKVVENGNPIERKKWFPDIEPLFKLLSYENVPPYLKGALREAIAAFVKVSPLLKDAIWKYLEQYELPVIVGPSFTTNAGQQISTKLYDMRYELSEVEARRERYPSTISYLNLVNSLIREERDLSDSGHRFLGIYKFVYEHVFGPFPQRAYANPCEKWELVLACLEHFHMVLSMFWTKDLDYKGASVDPFAVSLEAQLPALELMKDLMSGKQAFRNVMNILLMGVNTLIDERSTKVYGHILEKAVHLSLQIILLALDHDLNLADAWRPLYQPLDVILAHDHKQIVVLLEYVRYDLLPGIQQCSIKFTRVLSSRISGLVQILIKAGTAKSLVEDYATCLEYRFDETQALEEQKDDIGLLILQMLIENIPRPVPNVAHLLLSFDVENRVERTKLQPKFYYSCLKVVLDNLEKLSRPDINALLHELSFQLLYELCVDSSTGGPTMDLLSTKRYQCFCKHIETIGVAPLPKGNSYHNLRVSALHQRGWLLKLLALELHVADTTESAHRETCIAILLHTFGEASSSNSFQENINTSWNKIPLHKNKLLELLNIVRFRPSDIDMKYPQTLTGTKYETKVLEILTLPESTELGGIYCYSERGDRLIDIDALEDKLFEMSEQMGLNANEAEKEEFRVLTHNLMRWGLRYNKMLEEQTAQLHMLTGWSQIVEVAISRRMSLLEDHSEILLELLDTSLSTTASPDCSRKMAIILTNVALTCMAKLRDERFLCPGGTESDGVTCVDIISGKQLPSGAYHSILVKLIMALQRNESSEPLRRRQYALLLSYMQYCGSILNPDVPSSVLRCLLSGEQAEDDEFYLHKIGKEQNELARANFSIIRKEAQAIVDLVAKDATQGSEAGKAISYYVLDAFVSIDHDMFFLNQIQSRGLLRSILFDISSSSSKEASISFESSQRLCTMEAELSLLLRICHKYGKHGAQILQSMSALDHLSSCALVSLHNVGISWMGHGGKERIGWSHGQKFVTPILRLVSCITSLVDSSEYLEVKNKIVREVLEFIRSHHLIFSQILKEDVKTTDDSSLERVYLAVFILCKVWPYEENDEHGFTKELFTKMLSLFNFDDSSSDSVRLSDLPEDKKSEVITSQLSFSLISYLYFLVRKKEMRLLINDPSSSKPTLETLLSLLVSVHNSLEKAGEEIFVLLNKIRDINELSRQEVDEIIKLCSQQDWISPGDDIRKRRYVAMIEMCRMAGNRDQLLSILLQIAESIIHILLLHFQDPESVDHRDLSSFCEKLHPVLERLEHLKEEKVGQNLKLFHRSVSTLKEMSIRNMPF